MAFVVKVSPKLTQKGGRGAGMQEEAMRRDEELSDGDKANKLSVSGWPRRSEEIGVKIYRER